MSAPDGTAMASGGSAVWRPPRAELVSATSALLLAVVMFAFKWYGVAGVPGRSSASAATTSAENGWQALTNLRWLMLATIAVTVASLLLHVSQRGHGTRTDTTALITLLGAATAALVCYRALIDLPMPSEVVDQKLGALLGVCCAIGIALGGFEALREERARTRRGRTATPGGRVARVPRAR
jgi:hypothetical protein